MSFRNIADWQDKVLKQEILDEIASGDVPVEVSWDDVQDKPTTFPAAWDDVTGVPAALTAAQAAGTASIRAIGTTATTAAAGNHTHTGSQIALTGYTAGTAGNVAATDSVNAAIAKLEARIAALETP